MLENRQDMLPESMKKKNRKESAKKSQIEQFSLKRVAHGFCTISYNK